MLQWMTAWRFLVLALFNRLRAREWADSAPAATASQGG
jgi:hypothetical protein